MKFMGKMPMLRGVTVKMAVLRAAVIFILYGWAEGP